MAQAYTMSNGDGRVAISDSTWIMKSKKNSNIIGDADNFKKVLPNGKVTAINGGTARDIIGAMRVNLANLPSTECAGDSGLLQHRGAVDAEMSVAESRRARSLGQLTTSKNGIYRALLLGAICVVRWNINDVFEGGGARTMIEFANREDTMRFLMRVFMETLEMGAIAKRFPRASFTVGGSAATWKVPRQFDLFANAARLGIALAGNNVASGIRDHSAIEHLLQED
jgi:hypothetical protein